MVDRTVARAASYAVAKAVRADRCCEKFVAVTCHEDILPWLEPDWVLDMRTGLLTRRRLRRPGIEIELFRCDRSAWRMFAPHHYLSDRLHPACRCYVACWDGVAVAFVAVLHAAGYVGRDRVSRLVVSGDYQGIGIGSRVLDAVCALHAAMGRVIGITTSHPMLINGLKKNKNWKCRAIKKTGGSAHSGWGKAGRRRVTSSGRTVVAFDYIGGWKEATDRSATDTRHGNAGCYRVGDSGDIEMQPGSLEKARR
jgi:GNAT superfamily N-acetyltransferase